MLKDMQEYAKTQKQTKGVFVPEQFLRNLPITTAALLAQIVYWHLPAENGESKLRVKKINKETGEITYWIAKKRDDWKAECGITPREYDKAIKQLTDLGLVETKLFRFNGAVMTHVRLLEQNFLKVYDDWAQTQETSRFDEKCKIGEENKTPGNPDFTKNAKSDKPSNDADFTENVNSNLRKVLNQNLRKSEPLNREYITEITNKEYPYYIKGGTASPEGSACPPAVNNTNDGIPGDVDAISGVGLSLPSKKDNEVLNTMMSSSGQNTIVVTPSNTGQTNDGIKQREQSLSGSPSQHGVQIEHKTATTQNLPEGYMLLKDWLPRHCKIPYVIDTVLAKLPGDMVVPPQGDFLRGWGDVTKQIRQALPTARQVLTALGYDQDHIDHATRQYTEYAMTPALGLRLGVAPKILELVLGPEARQTAQVYFLAS